MEVRVYDRNLVTPVLWTVEWDRVRRLMFSTKIHGGFNLCSFRLDCSPAEAWDWLAHRLNYRVVVSHLSSTLFEGRLEDVQITPEGGATLTALGYYSNLGDIPYATAYADVASEIIKDVLTANCAQISTDYTHIAATDVTVDSSAGEEYLDLYPMELFARILAFSDTTSKTWDFAIWEDRVPWLVQRAASSVDWFVNLEDLQGFSFGISLGQLWNAAYALYRTLGVLSRTADADNADSQTKFGLERKKVIHDVGEVAAANAQAARDGFLAEYAKLYPSMGQSPTILGPVYDSNGIAHDNFEVRAGQVMRIRDFLPDTISLDSVSRDGFSTFYIAETEYDAESRGLRVVFERREPTVEQLMAQILKAIEPFDWLGANQAALEPPIRLHFEEA